jgi:hypothetical protein
MPAEQQTALGSTTAFYGCLVYLAKGPFTDKVDDMIVF